MDRKHFFEAGIFGTLKSLAKVPQKFNTSFLQLGAAFEESSGIVVIKIKETSGSINN